MNGVAGGAPRSLAAKALDVLAAFGPDAPELTLSEIGRRAAMPLTTTHRIVRDLVAWGALEHGAGGAYHIGLRLWEVASLAPRGQQLREAAPEVQEEVLAGPLERWTPLTMTDPVRLRRVLADVRRQDYAVSDRQVTMDALSVAAPVRGPGDEVVAALSLVVHNDGAQPAALAPLIRAAARSISRALGSPAARQLPAAIGTA